MKRGTASPLRFFNLLFCRSGGSYGHRHHDRKDSVGTVRAFPRVQGIYHYKGIGALYSRKKKADELKQKLDVFSVEGEVVSFTEELLTRLDTLFTVSLTYSVGESAYYTDAFLFNRGSLRVGQKIILLCDNEDYSNVSVQNGEENEAVKRLIWRFAWLVVGMIMDFIGTFLDWNDILAEYNRAGIGAAAFLTIAVIVSNILAHIKSDE